ncbi:MAG: BCCT family transporter [Ornithinimicrobium sp.]
MSTTARKDEPPAESPDPTEIPATSVLGSIDKFVFTGGLILVVAFAAWGVFGKESLQAAADQGLNLVTTFSGWAFIMSGFGFVVFALALAFSRYGRIRLGTDQERPEFTTVSWFAMMFAAGMGIGLVFFGASEPLSHFIAPPLGLAEPGTDEAAQLAMQYTIFHWGLHPWALYAVVGMALAYTSFRKGNPNLLSSIVMPNRPVEDPMRRAIDTFAIFITVFGAATSLGLGALQINSGLNSAYGITKSNTVAIIVILVLAVAFAISAVSGVGKGIKIVSNINMGLAGTLALFVLVLGPTLIIVNTFVEMIGNYTTQIVPMSFRTGIYGGQDWLQGWTLFYWAWWMSWAPFVGTFIARISRGRTIRQFVICVLLVPTMVSSVWFSILGGTAIHQQQNGVDLAGAETNEGRLFLMLDQLPLGAVTATVVVLLITFFFVSSADSASVVLGMLSSKGNIAPHKFVVLLWGGMIALTAIALLVAGGLAAIQQAAVVIAVPFLVLLIFVCIQLFRQLREEPVVSTVPEGVYTALYEELGASKAEVDEKLAAQRAAPDPDHTSGPSS